MNEGYVEITQKFKTSEGKELGHTESTDAVVSKNLCHFLVRVEELFVFGVLEIVLLDVCPKLFDTFSTASLFFANDIGEVSAELHGFGESGSFGHFGCFFGGYRLKVKRKSKGL